jgi:hypothetical protein
MDVLLHNLSVCDYKTYSKVKRKIYMLTLGLEPMWFVSEEYCHHALTRTATSGCGQQPPQHPSVEASENY